MTKRLPHSGQVSPTSVFITPCLDNPAHELPNFFGTSAAAPGTPDAAAGQGSIAIQVFSCPPGMDAQNVAHFWRLHGDTGEILDEVTRPGWVGSGYGPYGGAVNSEGDLYVNGLETTF